MYCKYCERVIDDDSSFCKFCGRGIRRKHGIKTIIADEIIWLFKAVVVIFIVLIPFIIYKETAHQEHREIPLAIAVFLGFAIIIGRYIVKLIKNIYRWVQENKSE